MTRKQIEEQFQECLNYHSHEGEWEVFGKKITIFRAEPKFTKREDGSFDREGEETAGMVCGFIDNSYFTGWYEQGPNDLKYTMEDICSELFKNRQVDWKFSGTLWSLSEEEKELYSRNSLVESVRKEVKRELPLLGLDPASIRMDGTLVWKDGIFFGTASSKGWFALSEIMLEEQNSFTGEELIREGKVELASPELIQFFKEAFSYTLSF